MPKKNNVIAASYDIEVNKLLNTFSNSMIPVYQYICSSKIKGNKGFGYDPIFIPKGQKITFGQMSKLRKIKMDHRFIAFQKLRKKIKIL